MIRHIFVRLISKFCNQKYNQHKGSHSKFILLIIYVLNNGLHLAPEMLRKYTQQSSYHTRIKSEK